MSRNDSYQLASVLPLPLSTAQPKPVSEAIGSDNRLDVLTNSCQPPPRRQLAHSIPIADPTAA